MNKSFNCNSKDKLITIINGVDKENKLSKTVYNYSDFMNKAYNLGFTLKNEVKDEDIVIVRCLKKESAMISIIGCILNKILFSPCAVGELGVERDEFELLIKKLSVQYKCIYILTDYDNLYKNTDEVKYISYYEYISRKSEGIKFRGYKDINYNVNDDIMLITSSGTFEDKIGTIINYENLYTSIINNLEVTDLKTTDSVLNILPLTHCFGLIGNLLTPMVKGCNIYILEDYLLVNSELIMDIIGKCNISILCLSNFVLKILNRACGQFNLDSLENIVIGGECISVDSMKYFCEKYSVNAEVFSPAYGLTEATLTVSCTEKGELFKEFKYNRNSICSLGRLNDNCKIFVKKEDKESLVGEVYISGPNVPKKYITLNGEISIFKKKYIPTGDLGFIKDDLLYIVGRSKNIIIKNAKNYNIEILENLLIDKYKLNDRSICIYQNQEDNRIYLIYEKKIDALDFERIKKNTSNIIDKYISVDSMPKTNTLKIARRRIAEIIENESLQ